MPRGTKIQERHRRQIDPREYFEYTTPRLETPARPVDPYARPGEVPRVLLNRTGATFQEALSKFIGALESGTRIKRLIDEEDKKAGKIAAIRGEGVPEGASSQFVVGHEIIKGKAAAADLDAELAAYHEANKEADLVTYRQGQQRIIKQFLAGRSDAFIEGIMADAIGLEEKYQSAYLVASKKRIMEKGLENIGKAWLVDADPIFKDTTQPTEAKAQALREMLTGAQVVGASTYNLSKLDVTKHVVDIVGQRAIMEGNPDLLLFLSKPDKDGIRPIDHPDIGKAVFDYVRAAENERDKNRHEFEKRLEKAKRDIEAALTNHIMTALLDTDTDTKPIQELLHKYSDPSRNELGIVLDPSRVIAARKLIAERGEGFADSTDQVIKAQTMKNIIEGKLSLEDLPALRHHFERSDFNSMMNLALSVMRPKTTTSQRRKDFNQLQRIMVKDVGGIDPINGPQREAFVISRSNAWWEEYVEEHNGKEPTSEEYTKQLITIRSQAFQLFGGAPSDGAPSGGEAPKASQPKAADKQPAFTKPATKGAKADEEEDKDLNTLFDELINRK